MCQPAGALTTIWPNARAELLCRQCAIRLRRTSDVPASGCAYNHLAKRKRRYHHLVRLQRYTGRLSEERNNFVGRLLRDPVESLNTWREGRAYVRGRWGEVRPHHDQYRHEAPDRKSTRLNSS